MASLASLMRNQTPEARGGLAHGLNAHIERFSRSLAGTSGYGQFRHSDLSQKGTHFDNILLASRSPRKWRLELFPG